MTDDYTRPIRFVPPAMFPTSPLSETFKENVALAIDEQRRAAMIPFAKPSITPAEIAAVTGVLESGWLTSGPKVAEFEAAFAKACGEGCHAVAVSSATMGLTLAMIARGFAGRAVAVPTWTFTATAEAIEAAGGRPKFYDIDPWTLNLKDCPLDAEAHVPVHIAGIRSLRRTSNSDWAVEDAAHCMPYRPEDRAIAVFSFYANKPITCGEGGMVVTKDKSIADKIRAMRWHGFDVEAHDRHTSGYRAHHVTGRGFKGNMTDLQAALGLEQLKRMEETRTERRLLVSRYRTLLRGCMLPPKQREDGSEHLFIIRVPDRDQFIKAMHERGVACGVHYLPLHRHPYWRNKYQLDPRDFPNAEAANRTAVSLPLYAGMTEEQQDSVIEAAREILT